jgi:putative transposase
VNWVLSCPDLFAIDTTRKAVPVKVGPTFEERPLHCLSSQMKQGLVTQLHHAVSTLATLKAQGKKVGGLKYKKQVQCIPLKQTRVTYQVNIDKNRIKLQKLPPWLRVRGLSQIPPGAELANAQLLERHGDYFLHVVTYQPTPKRQDPPPQPHPEAIGLDPGLAKQFVFSNGVVVEYRVPLPKRLRRLYRQFSRTQKGSRNRWKIRQQIENQFHQVTNIKRDLRNQVVAYLRRYYPVVCFQDENLRAWQRIWGRKMLDLSLGAFFRVLKERCPTPVELPRHFPSTQLCSACGSRQKLTRAERVYQCPRCGLVRDRDYNAALNLLQAGLEVYQAHNKKKSALDPERIEVTPAEITAATQHMVEHLDGLPFVRASRVKEPGSLMALA